MTLTSLFDDIMSSNEPPICHQLKSSCRIEVNHPAVKEKTVSLDSKFTFDNGRFTHFFLCLTIIISFSCWSSPHKSELTWKKKVNYGISKDVSKSSLFLSRCRLISMKKRRIIVKWKWKLKRDLSIGWRNLSSLNKNDESSCDYNSFFFPTLFLFSTQNWIRWLWDVSKSREMLRKLTN